MKPMIVLPPETMSKEDIQMLRDNGLCVVEATEPSRVKFMDPISSAADRPRIEQAAIELSRKLLNGQWYPYGHCQQLGRPEFSRMFIDCLTKGTPLDMNYQTDEEIRQEAKEEELRRLGREEAKTEKAAAKAAKSKSK